MKKAEKGRTSVTEGIPAALPSLALAAKLQRKAEASGWRCPAWPTRPPGWRRAAADARPGGRPPGADDVADGEGGARAARPRRSGSCCSPWSDWPARSGSTPRRRCCPRSGAFRAEVEASG